MPGRSVSSPYLVKPHQKDLVVDFFEGDVEIVSLAAHGGQIRIGNNPAGVLRQNPEGDFVIRHSGKGGDFSRREAGEFFGEIQAAIRRLPGEKRLAQIDGGGLSVGG